MHINISYDQEFYDLIMYLKAKYPKRLFDLSGIGRQLDLSEISKDFFTNRTSMSDVSVDPNSNVDDTSVISYDREVSKPIFLLNSYYVLWKKMRQLYGIEKANSIIEKQLTGSIYINDFTGFATLPYCYNYSTYDVALQGLPMIKKIKSIQPKHLYAFKSQMEQFITIAANSTLGATGISDLFITMSAYIKRILNTLSDAGFSFKDEKSVWKYVKENIVSFIYTINQPMRAATQSPFTNVSIFDDFFLDRLIPDYKWYVREEVYVADKEITKKIQELFLDIMNEELRRTPVTFPVTTACFSLDDDKNIKDKEFLNMISEKNLEFGFINIYVGKTSTLSSCCRLRSDVEKAQLYTNNFGAGSTKIGSQNVTTINLPRIAFKNKNNINKFFIELEELAYDAQDINNAKRHILRKRIDSGNHPLYALGFINLNSQFSTIGINGFYECLEILGYDIMTKEGQEFGIKILNLLNSINDKLEKKYSAPHNLEQIPAENVSIKLAEKDKLLKYNEKYDFYSNQFIPLVHKANLLDRIHLQGVFDEHFSGGAICHLNVEQKIDNPEIIKRLIESSAKQGVVYFAINFVLQLCENSHMNISNAEKCITCGSENLESYTRIVGYLTPVRSWNEKRRVLDFPNRQFYVNGDFKQVA